MIEEWQKYTMENPPNQTLYINNLNEKVKKEGKEHSCNASGSDFCISSRAEEVTLRHFLTIRTHSGHCCNEDTQNEGTSLCSVPSKHLKIFYVIGVTYGFFACRTFHQQRMPSGQCKGFLSMTSQW